MSEQNALVIKNINGGFKEQTKYFTNVIYNNFEHLKNVQEMHHSINEIDELLHSINMYCILIYNKKHKVIAYLIGEIIKLSDGRMIFFINYLYVMTKYQNLGIGSKLINLIISKIKIWKINGVMLMYDTMNDGLNSFFTKHKFKPDDTFKRNNRYEIISR